MQGQDRRRVLKVRRAFYVVSISLWICFCATIVCANDLIGGFYMGSEWCIHFKDESTMTFYYDGQREGDYEYFLEPYEENEVANIAGDKLTLVDFRSLDREDAHGQSMIISIKENGFMLHKLDYMTEFFPHIPFRKVDSPDPFCPISSLKEIQDILYSDGQEGVLLLKSEDGRLLHMRVYEAFFVSNYWHTRVETGWAKEILLKGNIARKWQGIKKAKDPIRITFTDSDGSQDFLVYKRYDGSVRFVSVTQLSH